MTSHETQEIRKHSCFVPIIRFLSQASIDELQTKGKCKDISCYIHMLLYYFWTVSSPGKTKKTIFYFLFFLGLVVRCCLLQYCLQNQSQRHQRMWRMAKDLSRKKTAMLRHFLVTLLVRPT